MPGAGWIGKATTVIDRSADGLDPVTVCRDCAHDLLEWRREEDRPESAYDGPIYADTMSGGCVYIGG